MSGVPVIRGTRVPVQTLFDYLADGYTLDQFLNSFPTVERGDALAILVHATEHLSMGAIRFAIQAQAVLATIRTGEIIELQ